MSRTPNDPSEFAGDDASDADYVGSSDQLDGDDTLLGDTDPLDEGYTPPQEEPPGYHGGFDDEDETLNQRLAQEEPESDAAPSSWNSTADPKAGQLTAPDEGLGPDEEKAEIGEEHATDGTESAEESAMHIVDDPDAEPL